MKVSKTEARIIRFLLLPTQIKGMIVRLINSPVQIKRVIVVSIIIVIAVIAISLSLSARIPTKNTDAHKVALHIEENTVLVDVLNIYNSGEDDEILTMLLAEDFFLIDMVLTSDEFGEEQLWIINQLHTLNQGEMTYSFIWVNGGLAVAVLRCDAAEYTRIGAMYTLCEYTTMSAPIDPEFVLWAGRGQ